MPKASDFVEIVKLFERNIQRSLAPSLVFFVMLAVADVAVGILPRGYSLPHAQARLDEWTAFLGAGGKSLGLVVVVFLFLLVGTSYALSALHQVLFDNFLRYSFKPWRPYRTKMSEALVSLRAAVIRRLEEEEEVHKLKSWVETEKAAVEENDFILYEVLGGIDPTGTYDYVDRSKSMGVFFVSTMIVTALALPRISPFQHWSWTFTVLLLVLFLLWYVGLEAVRHHYRSRAFRLYVNFLMIPDMGIDHRLREKFGPPDKTTESSEEKED